MSTTAVKMHGILLLFDPAPRSEVTQVWVGTRVGGASTAAYSQL